MRPFRMTGPRACLIVLAGLLLQTGESPAQSSAPSALATDSPSPAPYLAGTRVQAPGGSASFPIPKGWHGEPLEDMAAILLTSDKVPGFVLVFATVNQTADDLAALLGEPQPITDAMVFQPVGRVVRQGNRLTASYVAGELTGRGVAVLGPNDQGILFLHGRPKKEEAAALPFLIHLADEVRFDQGTTASPSP